MHESIKYLLDFVHEGHSKTVRCHEAAVEEFFEDVESEYQLSSLQDVVEEIGRDLFNVIYPSFMEYFLSDVFMDNDKPWNLIDAFMKKHYRLLNKEQREYTKLLRNSYMSVYEVLEVTPGESMLVKNLIEDEAPILVSEKSATQQIVKWTKLGMRLIRLEDGRAVSAAGLLSMPMEAAEEAVDLIKTITAEIKKLNLPSASELESYGEDPDLLQKKIWAKEIVTALINHWLAVRSNNVDILNSMHNQDGDIVQFCKLQFPILADDVEEVAEIIDGIPGMDWQIDANTDMDLDLDVEVDVNSGYHWRWTGQAAHTQMDILFADVLIDKKKLIVQTNSMERAEAARNTLTAVLDDLIGTGLISMENMDQLIKKHQSKKDTEVKKTGIPPEVEHEIIMKYKQEYYQKWLDIKVPALDDKTPRVAAKSEAGKKALVELFKYMENMELTQAKNTGAPVYDFSSLWEELGVAEEMQGQGSAK